MSLFLYLFFIPNKRSVGITHTKYYRTQKNIKIRQLTRKEHKTEGVVWYNNKCLEEQDTTLIYIYEVPPKTS